MPAARSCCASVAERVADYLLTTSVQTGASYDISRTATERVAEARARIATLVGAARPEEIVFGHSTTVLVRFLATAMASQFQPGDEIVVTDFDHESNIGPWSILKDRGVIFKIWPIDRETLQAGPGSARSRDGAAHQAGLRDPCVEYSGHHQSRFARSPISSMRATPASASMASPTCRIGRWMSQALGVDFYVFSLYKLYGPHQAVLYGRYDHLAELDGLYHYFYGKDRISAKLEPGNPNYELAWGSAAIVDYLEMLGDGTGRPAIERAFRAIARHEGEIGEQLLSWLRAQERRQDLRRADGRSRDPGADDLIHHGRPIAGGNRRPRRSATDRHSPWRFPCPPPDRKPRPGARGVIRISMVHYNSKDEVNRLIGALEKAMV